MAYTGIDSTLTTLREEIRKDFGETMLDEMDDEDVIMYALRYFTANALDEDLE